MATRIYFPSSSGTPDITPSPGTWTETTGFDRLICSTSRGSTAMTNKTQSRTANSANNTWLDRMYISGPLADQTFGASTVKGTIRALESAVNDNVDAMRLLIRVIAPDGSTVRGTIYGPTNSTVAEFNTSLRAKRLATGGATTSVTITEGDYLVIEIGATATTGGTSISTSINYGDNSATDLGDNETDTAANNPFIEFAANMKFLQRGYGQAQADIKAVNSGFGQTQTLIAYTTVTATWSSTTSSSWPDADTGGPWTIRTVGTGSASHFSADSSVGKIAVLSSTTDVDGAILLQARPRSSEWYIELSEDVINTGSISTYFVNGSDQTNPANNSWGILIQIDSTNGNLTVFNVFNASVNGSAVAGTYVAGDTWVLKFRIILTSTGTSTYSKAWKKNTTEPNWQVISGSGTIMPDARAPSIIVNNNALSTLATTYSWDNLSIIPAFPQGYGQANADIKTQNRGYGQAQAQILKLAGYGQAQAQMRLYAGWAQVLANISGSFNLPITDNFNRTVSVNSGLGTSSNGDTYSTLFGNTTGIGVDGDYATYTDINPASVQALTRSLVKSANGIEVTFTFKISALPSVSIDIKIGVVFFGLSYQIAGAYVNINSSGTVSYSGIVEGGTAAGSSVSINTEYTMKAQIFRATEASKNFITRAKFWQTSTTEPGWSAVGENTVTGSYYTVLNGFAGINQADNGGTESLLIKDFTISEAHFTTYGQAQAFILPRLGFGQTQAILNQQRRTAQAQAQMRLYAGWAQAHALIAGSFSSVVDTFTRSVTDGLGTANTGGAWTFIAGTAANADVNGSQATIINDAASQAWELQSVAGPKNPEISFQVAINKTPATQIQNFYILANQGSLVSSSSNTAGTRAIIGFQSDGTVRLTPGLGNNSSGTTALISYSPGDLINAKLQIFYISSLEDITVKIKLWKNTDPEPGWTTGIITYVAGMETDILPGHVRLFTRQNISDANAPFTFTVDNINVQQAFLTQSGQAQADIKAQGRGFGQAQAYRTTYYLFDTFSTTRDSGWNFSDNRTAYGPISGTFDSTSFTGHTIVSPNATNSIVAVTTLGPNKTFTTDFTLSGFDQGGSIAIQERTTLTTVTAKGWGAKVTVNAAGAMTLAIFKDSTQISSASVGTFVGDDTYRIVFEVIESGGTGYLKAKVSDLADPDPGWQVTGSTAYGALDSYMGYSFNMSASNSNPIDINFIQTYAIPFYWGFGQAQASIVAAAVNTRNGFAQAQADIKQTYSSCAQSQADIKQKYNAFGQSQADIKATNFGLGQANTRIATGITELHDTFTRTIGANGGFGTADSGTDWTSADNSGYSVNGSQGVFDTNIEPSTQNQHRVDIRNISFDAQFKFSNSPIIFFWNAQPGFLNDSLFQIQLSAGNLSVQYIEGSTTVDVNTDYIIGFDTSSFYQLEIESFYTNFSTLSKRTRYRIYKLGSSIPDWYILDFTSVANPWGGVAFSGSFGDGPLVYVDNINAKQFVPYGNGQAQADIKSQGRGFAQAQADIKATNNGFGQANSDIKTTYFGLGQSNADIKATNNGLGQAQATIQGNVFGQSQADIKQTYNQFGQAQADIKAVNNGLGQSQADIKAVGNGLGQAQSDVKAVGYGEAQAQSDIKATSFGLGQSQADIKQTYSQFAQSNADILARNNAFGQTQSDIKQTYFAEAQAQASILITSNGFGQANADIKATGNGLGQAQGDILAVGNAFAQSQTDIKQTYTQSAQAQADILNTYFGLGQSQADIKAAGYGESQANADILATNSAFGQSQADIRQTYFGLGQSQADILNTYSGVGQSQADIKAAGNGFGQCQAYIYIPQNGRPNSDISVTGWVRVVI